MGELLKGAPVAKRITEEVRLRSEKLKEAGITPTLAIVRVGAREDDLAYQRGAVSRAGQAGIEVRICELPESSGTQAVLELVNRLNADNSVHGVLIMRPLPRGYDEAAVCAALSPEKDVDGITAGSLAAVFTGTGAGFAPCTAVGCLEILKSVCDITGKHAVVVGRSLVIGKPVAMLLLKENATVTVCHTKTRDLEKLCGEADILVAAAGKAGFIGKEAACAGQIVLDVGIHLDENGGMCGDVKTDELLPLVSAITPVPGGVGSVTTSVLMSHVVIAAERSIGEAKEK